MTRDQTDTKLQHMPQEVRDLRQSTLKWLDTMRVSPSEFYQYRLNKGADPSIFASCFAVAFLQLWGALDDLSQDQRRIWSNWIQSFQDETSGFFFDVENAERATDALHDVDHLNQQLTTFCLSALDALGTEPLYPLYFLQEWKDEGSLIQWLESLDWHNPWNCGNKVMFLGIFMAYEWKRTRDAGLKATLDTWFDWHDHYQNPQTGFWGEGRKANYIDGLGGAYHQYVVYNYMERPIQYADKIIDRTLFLQQYDGMYSPYLGGASCYELDAVDIMVQLYFRHDYRRREIEIALESVMNAVMNMQNPDGGFCWARKVPFQLKRYSRMTRDLYNHRSMYYWYLNMRAAVRSDTLNLPKIRTGWTKQTRTWEDSSIFDTWFRVLTIAECSEVLNGNPFGKFNWGYLKAPGLGWFPSKIHRKNQGT